MPTLDAINDQIAQQLGIGLNGRTRLALRVAPTPATLLKFVTSRRCSRRQRRCASSGWGAGTASPWRCSSPDCRRACSGRPRRFGEPARPTLSRSAAATTHHRRAGRPQAAAHGAHRRHRRRLGAGAPLPRRAAALRGRSEDGHHRAPVGRRDRVWASRSAAASRGGCSSSSPTPRWSRQGAPGRPRRLSQRGDDRVARRMAEEIEQVRVDVRGVLGCTRITLSRLLELEPGEVLLLDRDEEKPLPISVQGRTKLLGTPSVSGGRPGHARRAGPPTPPRPPPAPWRRARGERMTTASPAGERRLDMLLDVPLDVSVELGRCRMTIQELLALGPGSVIELDKVAGEPLDILINDRLVARGEAVGGERQVRRPHHRHREPAGAGGEAALAHGRAPPQQRHGPARGRRGAHHRPRRRRSGAAGRVLIVERPPAAGPIAAGLLLAALALAALVTARRRRRAPRLVEIVESASLGPKRTLVVARLGEELLVLGSSEGGIALLASRPAPPLVAAAAAPVPSCASAAARPAPRRSFRSTPPRWPLSWTASAGAPSPSPRHGMRAPSTRCSPRAARMPSCGASSPPAWWGASGDAGRRRPAPRRRRARAGRVALGRRRRVGAGEAVPALSPPSPSPAHWWSRSPPSPAS